MSVLQFYGNTTPIFYLYTDNQAAEHIATQPTMIDHSRFIDLRHHSIRQDYIEHGMRIGGISSKENTSDILTKFLQPDLHHIHTNQLFSPRPPPPPRQLPPSVTPEHTNNMHLRNMVTHARNPRVIRRPHTRRHIPIHKPPRNPQPCPLITRVHEKRAPLSHKDPHPLPLLNRVNGVRLPHGGPHLRPLSNRVISSKAQSSHKDPHFCHFISKAQKAQCHTRTLTHDPFIEVHAAAYMSHEDPHLRSLPNRVISSKAKTSHKDPHLCPFTSKVHKA